MFTYTVAIVKQFSF